MFLIFAVLKNYALLSKGQPHMRTYTYNKRGCTCTNATQCNGEVGGGGEHQHCFRFGGGARAPSVPSLPPPMSRAWPQSRGCLCTILRAIQSGPRLVSAIGRVIAFQVSMLMRIRL